MKEHSNSITIGNTVRDFYRELPFNQHSSVEMQIADIENGNPVNNYPVLPPLLQKGTRVLEVGSGTGWFANSIAHYHGSIVTGIDFNPRAVEFSQQVAAQLHSEPTSAQFFSEDLFTYTPEQAFDVVVSLGVLHHTRDCLGAINRLCEQFVRPGGYVFIGLYHSHGRRPFLKHFADLRAGGATDAEMMERYSQLHSVIKDKTHLQSWFRDQVLHPHETQHTLAEMVPILKTNGLKLLSTSISRFESIEDDNDVESVLAMEPSLESIAAERLAQNQYFPGFFLFLAQKQHATANNDKPTL